MADFKCVLLLPESWFFKKALDQICKKELMFNLGRDLVYGIVSVWGGGGGGGGITKTGFFTKAVLSN